MFTPEERTRLIEENVKYAYKIGGYFAYRRKLYSIEEDLKAEALVGLIAAVDNYEDDRGMKLSSYIHTRINWHLNRVYPGLLKTVRPPHRKQDYENHYHWTKADDYDISTIVAPESTEEEEHDRNLLMVSNLKVVLHKLPLSSRDRDIIYRYLFVRGITYRKLGEEYGISYERVRQLIARNKIYLRDRYYYELTKQGEGKWQ